VKTQHCKASSLQALLQIKIPELRFKVLFEEFTNHKPYGVEQVGLVIKLERLLEAALLRV